MVRQAFAPSMLLVTVLVLLVALVQRREATPEIVPQAVQTGVSESAPGVRIDVRTVEVEPELLVIDPAGGALKPIAPAEVRRAAPRAADRRTAAGTSSERSRTTRRRPDSTAKVPGSEAPARGVLTIPAGTPLPVTLESRLSSTRSSKDHPIVARLRHPLIVGGRVAVPEGSVLAGTVTEAKRAGRVSGRARVAFRFHLLQTPGGDVHPIRTQPVARLAPADRSRDARAAAPAAAAGAVAGIATGVHPAIGAGALATVAIARRGAEVDIPPGTAMTIRLQEPLTLSKGSHEPLALSGTRERPAAASHRRAETPPLRIPGTVSLRK